MKKISSLAIGLGAMALLASASSCSANSKSDSASDTAYAEESAVADDVKAPADSLAAIFTNPEKKSEAATDSTYAETASGLKYLILREGKGKSPSPTSMVEVHYEGRLTNGTVFDSSYSRGEAATFPLNRVIPGWTEGLQLMKENGKAVFYIPSNLGYGPQGAPPVIPPNADLVFTVELLKVD